MAKRPRTLGADPYRHLRYERERRQAKHWRRWYSLAAWKRRREDQLFEQPLCERHLKRGQAVEATVANHRVPHRGDWDLFIEGELESLCKTCHDGEVQREEKAAGRQQLRRRLQGGG